MLGSGAQTTIDTIYATTKKAVETATTEGIKDITKSNVCFMCKMLYIYPGRNCNYLCTSVC